MANIPFQFWRTRRPHPMTKLHGIRIPIGLMMSQITFWFNPAVQATDGLETCDIACSHTIWQHSHVILLCHGAFCLIVLGEMSRCQWGLLSCKRMLSHPIHRQRYWQWNVGHCGYSCFCRETAILVISM